jgi:hypothetical protein
MDRVKHTKLCIGCNKLFTFMSFDCETENRRYCSRDCSNKNNADKLKLRIGNKNPNWKHGLNAVNNKNGSIRKLLPNNCNRCGSNKYLRAHHINRNRKDNRLENLEIICESCHNKEHNRVRFLINLRRDAHGRKLAKERS